MTNDSLERRHFWRAQFRAGAKLKQGGQTLPCHLIDISLKGALLELVGRDETGVTADQGELLLELASGTAIRMQVSIVHRQGKQLGLRCDNIDIDSLTHLRRMIELNAGDPQVSERDLAALLRENRSA